MSRIVLIGANHAGTAAANTILDKYPKNELTIVDRNDNISYLGCGTALWIGRQIDGYEGLFYCSADQLKGKGARVLMETSAERVDFAAGKVTIAGRNGIREDIPYDKLILATGSVPIMPAIPGNDLGGIQPVKLFQDGKRANDLMNDPAVRSVAVIGAGYIGVELAEAVCRRGKNALLFEAETTSLSSYYDDWFTHDMDGILRDKGIQLHFGEKVREFKGSGKISAVLTDKGEYQAQMAIMAIGFRPNTVLARDSLETIANGAYKVNRRQETNVSGVYAVGDCATVFSNALKDSAYIALATNAVRGGIIAAHNACGTVLESPGVQGSNGISIFGYNMVSTGISLKAAAKAGFDALAADWEDLQKPAFIKDGNKKVKLRVVYDRNSRRLLGAQMASRYDISMGIHMFSLAIEEGVTIDKLKLLDIFFLPHFNQPYNYITMAALTAK
ncbi:MAG: FAD-dependent oxidoreductase [Planctomycetota bacterium]|jgi:NADPH-dependent 2,4-dienoyl-CoA reductase/sulfur reductase-like enzyme|nr:FAD-dependent oxidoreductase [Planctomycetota bacterium]